MPFQSVEKFTFIENSSKSVEKSYSMINEIIENGTLDSKGIEQPEEIVPKVMCDET